MKLYYDWCPRDWVEYETKIGRIVCAAGLPAPAIGEIVEVNGRRGVIYERVEGISMLETFKAKPWTPLSSAHTLAKLHAAIHACAVPADLPSQREGFARSIRAAPNPPPDWRDAALRALDALPDGNQLCHGDLHPDNVMMTARGPLVIDWMTAKRGNPLADVARTLLLLTLGEPPDPIGRRLAQIARHLFIPAYFKRYFELRPHDDARFAAWQPIIAVARLNERIVGEETRLLALVRAGLERSHKSSHLPTTNKSVE